ncbi:hypothetical protein BDZ91DRAFT_846989 [Kalaharituber pfeilii]|nr:hypothetical protein BDZ91DRAFT_846989 [Kalaharituber pfeilii]
MSSHAYVIVRISRHRETLILCDPAEVDVPPHVADGVFNVMDPAWGADTTASHYATQAFQSALNTAGAYVAHMDEDGASEMSGDESGQNDFIDPIECVDVKVKNCIGVSFDDPFSTKTRAVDTDVAKSWAPADPPRPQFGVLFEGCIARTRLWVQGRPRRAWFACFTEMESTKAAVENVRNVMIDDVRVWERGQEVAVRIMRASGGFR